MGSVPAKDLTRLLNKEASFRIRSIEFMMTIVRGRDVPSGLRALTILVLALFTLISFQLCVLILHVIYALIYPAAEKVQFAFYEGLFGAEWVASMALAIPLLPKLDSFGEARRLEEKLQEIRQKRSERPKTKRRADGE